MFPGPQRENGEVTIIHTMTAEPPKPVFLKRTAFTRCCDLLSRIKNLLYEYTDATSLDNLEKNLLTPLRDLENNSNTDAGLRLTAPDLSSSFMKRKKRKSNSGTSAKVFRTRNLDYLSYHLLNQRKNILLTKKLVNMQR